MQEFKKKKLTLRVLYQIAQGKGLLIHMYCTKKLILLSTLATHSPPLRLSLALWIFTHYVERVKHSLLPVIGSEIRRESILAKILVWIFQFIILSFMVRIREFLQNSTGRFQIIAFGWEFLTLFYAPVPKCTTEKHILKQLGNSHFTIRLPP